MRGSPWIDAFYILRACDLHDKDALPRLSFQFALAGSIGEFVERLYGGRNFATGAPLPFERYSVQNVYHEVVCESLHLQDASSKVQAFSSAYE